MNLEITRQHIQQLDLSYIVKTMCSENYTLPRWTLPDAAHCCELYKNFLFLNKKHPGKSLVPTREIDEFWHNHILHTQKYVNDCLQIFGHYFHHQPASPDEDPAHLVQGFLMTKEYYLAEFNQPLVIMNRAIETPAMS